MTYINTQSEKAIGVLFPILGLIAVTCRFLCRQWRKSGVGVDDWLCLPALATVVVMGSMITWGAHKGFIGSHNPSPAALTADEAVELEFTFVDALKLEAIFWFLHVLGICLVKLTVLFFYRRIFTGRVFNILNWSLISFVVAWGIAFELAQIFACKGHPEYEWESYTTLTTKCVNTFDLQASNAFTDVVVDFAIIAFPHYWVWKLRMPTAQKVKVTLTFLLGSFAVAAGAVRTVVTFAVVAYGREGNASTQKVLGLPGYDILGIVSLALFWSYIEIGVALVACCLATMRPMFEAAAVKSILTSISSRTKLLASGSNVGIQQSGANTANSSGIQSGTPTGHASSANLRECQSQELHELPTRASHKEWVQLMDDTRQSREEQV